jgi:mannosyltransferase OCH1-like enzyme
MIPKNIFQTHKSKEYVSKEHNLLNAILSWVQFKPEYNYYFYNDKECENFMKDKIGGDIYKAYSLLPISVMKADLWRYCIIYENGGIYADVDTVCLLKPELFINESLLTIVPENETHLCQWVFSAPKKSPILKSVIDLSVERILKTSEIKGEHIIHHLTGPGVFTDGIEKYLNENDLNTFNNKKDYFKYPYDILRVFNCDKFHNKMVKHLFFGQKQNGWCGERDKYLL